MPRQTCAMMRLIAVLIAVLLATIENASAGEAGASVLTDEAGHEVIAYVARLPGKPRTDMKLALLLTFHGRTGNAEQLLGPASAAREHDGLLMG